MQVKVKKLRETAMLPTYQTEHAAAMDVHADLAQSKILQPLERAMIPTGLAFEIPEGYEMQVRARSGLSIKHGITMVNGVGTIDADYRGELNILVINLGEEPFTIEPGMRVAQLLVTKYDKVEWQETEELTETARGAGGFGSTGFDTAERKD
jgi:dUTP pyrophosphatase